MKEAFTDREFEDITSASFERLQLGSGDPFEVQDDEGKCCILFHGLSALEVRHST